MKKANTFGMAIIFDFIREFQMLQKQKRSDLQWYAETRHTINNNNNSEFCQLQGA